jgi:LysM repeat protein
VLDAEHHRPPRKLVGTLAFVGAIAMFASVSLALPTAASADQGLATWYGPGLQGNVMSNGQIFDMYDPTTTACNIYPLGTWLRITNPANGRSVVVQVRDRGAFRHAVDMSYAAFKVIADTSLQYIPITYEVVSGPSGKPIAPQAAPVAPAAPPAASAAPPARAAPASRDSRPAPSGQYLVQPGDTLFAIGSGNGIDPDTLARWNDVFDPNLISPGQTLRLTAPSTASAPVPSASHRYVVQPGDTLGGIADQFHVSLDRLGSLNGLADPYPIVIGQSLSIPNADYAPSKQTYVVQAGDSLWSIATNFGVGVDGLAAANQIADPSTIQPGTLLTIPDS